jgi:tripartite-type tricarboxylate transporter receptor subunit TctC
MKFPVLLAKLALCVGIAGAAALAQGQDQWPIRPIRIIVPFSPGGGGDAVVRVLTERLGQPEVIENRPGASGYIGAQLW